MAVQSVPYVETALSHSAELFRRNLQAGLPLGSAGGVVPATPTSSSNLTAGVAGCTDLAVSAPSSGMSVNVNAGQVIVPGSLGSTTNYGMGTGYGYPIITTNGGSAPTIASNAHATQIALTTQGAYYCYNDYSSGQVNLAIASSNPSNPRIDVVGAQVEDSAYSGSNNDWKLAVITGTAAASPTIPSFPANFIPLALVWVAAASSSVTSGNILDVRVAYNRNPYRASLYLANAQSLTNGTVTQVKYDTVLSDIPGGWNSGTWAWTAPVTGRYAIDCSVNCGGTSGSLVFYLYKNGAELKRGPYGSGGAVFGSLANACWLADFSKGDTISIYAYQNSGSSANLVSGSNLNYLDITLLSQQ